MFISRRKSTRGANQQVPTLREGLECAFVFTVLKYEFRPLPQVSSLIANYVNHLHRQYVNQRLSSQVNSLNSPSASFAYIFQGCSSLPHVFVVAQFGQHNGGLVRRNSLLCNPGCPGHFGQRG